MTNALKHLNVPSSTTGPTPPRQLVALYLAGSLATRNCWHRSCTCLHEQDSVHANRTRNLCSHVACSIGVFCYSNADVGQGDNRFVTKQAWLASTACMRCSRLRRGEAANGRQLTSRLALPQQHTNLLRCLLRDGQCASSSVP